MIFLWIIIGFAIGLLFFFIGLKIKVGGFENLAKEIINKSEIETEKRKVLLEHTLKEQEREHRLYLESKEEHLLKKISKDEERIKDREKHFDDRLTFLEKKLSELARKEELIYRSEKNLTEKISVLEEKEQAFSQELQRCSTFTEEELKRHLLEKIDLSLAKEKAERIQHASEEATRESEKIAARIITEAIQRLAVATVSEVATTLVSLPNEEMKSRIIGREGRNIRALEQATGVNFLIDETPGAIVISSFDPMRKLIAKLTLQELFSDGRVHATRILEAVSKAKSNAETEIRKLGENAALQTNVVGLHANIVFTLGQLSLRSSYGQNALKHSIEVSLLMGLMASELGLNVSLAKRIGLLHDIGKALTHEIEGSHTEIGYEFLLKYGESEEVANGVGAHHGKMLPCSLEGILCSAADSISASRPGAREEAAMHYFKRLKDLEILAKSFKGVENAYALHAGRELQVMVVPDLFDDASMTNLGREIAKKIETSLSYRDKIKVTLIRESRAVIYSR